MCTSLCNLFLDAVHCSNRPKGKTWQKRTMLYGSLNRLRSYTQKEGLKLLVKNIFSAKRDVLVTRIDCCNHALQKIMEQSSKMYIASNTSRINMLLRSSIQRFSCLTNANPSRQQMNDMICTSLLH